MNRSVEGDRIVRRDTGIRRSWYAAVLVADDVGIKPASVQPTDKVIGNRSANTAAGRRTGRSGSSHIKRSRFTGIDGNIARGLHVWRTDDMSIDRIRNRVDCHRPRAADRRTTASSACDSDRNQGRRRCGQQPDRTVAGSDRRSVDVSCDAVTDPVVAD